LLLLPFVQVSVSINQHRTDIFIGELETDQVLVVQHHQSVVVSVTQTVYGQKDHVVYGKSGQDYYIKSCHLGKTASEKLAGREMCEK